MATPSSAGPEQSPLAFLPLTWYRQTLGLRGKLRRGPAGTSLARGSAIKVELVVADLDLQSDAASIALVLLYSRCTDPSPLFFFCL